MLTYQGILNKLINKSINNLGHILYIFVSEFLARVIAPSPSFYQITCPPNWHPNVCKIAKCWSEHLRMSTLRKDGESAGIIMGNNNQNDMNCLQIIIKIVIPRDNLHLLRNFYAILGHL